MCETPSIKTSPDSGASNPEIMLNKVLLPQPDGPRIDTNSFSPRFIEMSERIGFPSYLIFRCDVSTLSFLLFDEFISECLLCVQFAFNKPLFIHPVSIILPCRRFHYSPYRRFSPVLACKILLARLCQVRVNLLGMLYKNVCGFIGISNRKLVSLSSSPHEGLSCLGISLKI